MNTSSIVTNNVPLLNLKFAQENGVGDYKPIQKPIIKMSPSNGSCIINKMIKTNEASKSNSVAQKSMHEPVKLGHSIKLTHVK